MKEHLEPNSNGKPAKEFSASKWGGFGFGRSGKEDEAFLKVAEGIQRAFARWWQSWFGRKNGWKRLW